MNSVLWLALLREFLEKSQELRDKQVCVVLRINSYWMVAANRGSAH